VATPELPSAAPDPATPAPAVPPVEIAPPSLNPGDMGGAGAAAPVQDEPLPPAGAGALPNAGAGAMAAIGAGATPGAGAAAGAGAAPPLGAGATDGMGVGAMPGIPIDMGTGAAPGEPPADGVFALRGAGWEAVDNEDCTEETQAVCPVYPQDNTSFGANVSPELSWTGAPAGTMSFALVLTDQTTDGGVHWVLWDIPADVMMLAAELPAGSPLTDPAGAQQVTNFGQMGYFGSGACGNVYEHRLFALGVTNLAPSDPGDVEAVREAVENSSDILGETFVRLQSRDYCTDGEFGNF
jgi:hypothetical protein